MSDLLFDSDAAANPPERRVFSVQAGSPVLIVAAGLADDECIPVYVRVGAPGRVTGTGCGSCGPVDDPDYLWAPLSRCGAPVLLCGSSNEYIERIPGTYMLGDPTADIVVAGDVNVTSKKLDQRYLYVAPYCSGTQEPVPCEPLAPLGLLTSW